MKVNNLALTERPMRFDDVIGQNVIVKNLATQSKMNKFFQSYLMYGHYGCGKTTTARILAAAINCHHKDQNGNPCGTCEHCLAVKNGCADMIEIDGASNTGVDNIRQLKEQVEYIPTVLDKKVYIIDEVHKLSDAAFNALLKVLEEPPAHVVFILATTDKDKIPATVLSRLAKYEFRRISTDTLSEHLKTVAERNDYNYTTEGLATIARNSDGSARNAIKMLEIVSELPDGVTEANAGLMIGLLDPAKVYDLLNLLLCGSALDAFQLATILMSDGWEPRRLTAEMIHICSDAVLASERLDLVDGSDSYKDMLKLICEANSVERVIVVLDFLMDLSTAMRESIGDRDVFRNRILLFSGDENNRINQLEKTVCLLTEKINKFETYHSYASPVADTGLNGSQTLLDDTELSDDNPPWDEDQTDDIKQPKTNEPTVTDTAKPSDDEAEQEKEPDVKDEPEQKQEPVQAKVEIDPFAMFAAKFHFAQNTADSSENESAKEAAASHGEQDAETDSETENITEAAEAPINNENLDYLAPKTDDSVEKFMIRVEEEQPVMDNLIEFGFTRVKEDEATVFETDEPAFYKIGKSFSDVMGGLPFGLRKVE